MPRLRPDIYAVSRPEQAVLHRACRLSVLHVVAVVSLAWRAPRKRPRDALLSRRSRCARGFPYLLFPTALPCDDIGPMELAGGSIIGGNYRVDRVVGEGGMGVVCLGTHLALGHRVAIKVLAAHALGSEMAVARFEREARMSASLAHEHVVRVFDFGRTESGAPFLVMEFLEGEDLATRIERDGPLPVAEALELLAQACAGLAEAHACGLVHRDLKPSNLFLARRATGTTVLKVIDFGIAKDAAALASHAMTRTNDVMGSPQYMSPEQVRDAKHVDARTDVWSLGATFYEALAGVPVFEAESLTDLLVKIATAPVPSLRARRAEVPPDVEAVLLRCLAREPEARYATVGELLDAVRALNAAPRRMGFGSTSLAVAATVSAADGAIKAARLAVGRGRPGSRVFAFAAAAFGVAVVVAFAGRTLTERTHAGYMERAPRPPIEVREAAILDLTPATVSDAARLAFAEGVQAYRDAARFRFVAAMRRAVGADPALALAQLLLAIETNAYDGSGAREHLRLARTHRAALTRPADALLEAVEAYVQPTWDLAAFEQRLLSARAAFPNEPLVAEWLGMARQLQGFPGEADGTYVEAERLDPRRSTLPWRRGQALLLAGRDAEALGAWSRCLDANPHAIGCRDNRARLAFAPDGRCAEAEADLRALIADEPTVARYPEALASALAARKSSAGVVVEVLAGRLALLPEGDRHAAELDDRSSLALLDGDLASAIRFARERVDLAHGAVDAQVAAVQRLASLLDEVGDRPGAAKVVERFLARRDAVAGARTSTDFSASLFVFARGAGRMSEAEFRAAWEVEAPRWDAPARMRARPSGVHPPSLEVWIAAHALAARDRTEAERALAVEANFAPLHPQVSPFDLYARGRAYALAGRAREARGFLERASRHCEVLGSVERVRARKLLADLDASEGRSSSACDGYAAVLGDLGHGSLRSVTAEAARADASRLGCGGRQ